VDNLNKAIAAHLDVLKGKTTEEMLEELGAGGVGVGTGMSQEMAALPITVRTAIRNQGGGDYNHSLFWQMMSKSGGGEPKGELAKAIDANFGSFSAFKEGFSKAGMGQFGSGWAWLVVSQGKLAIEPSANQDSPLSAGNQPLLGVDVWEHAYYLKYQNKRADYIAAWWNVVNWDFVAERHAKFAK
jgi:Fe-Mn family superoxide dismutase